LRAWPVWTVLGWNDIRQRYRRSVLGPFWITLSMAIFICVLGVIYSHLFKTDLATYLPFLALGFIVWGFISTMANDGCGAFNDSAHLIKQIKLPYSVYIMRVLWRNFIIFLHTIVIYVPVAIYFSITPTPAIFYAIPGLCLLIINVAWIATILGVVSTRYRDIQQIVGTIIQLAMFATPIMWTIDSLGPARIVGEVNPIYHLIELIRAPMLGHAPQPLSWLVACGLAIVGQAAAVTLLVAKSRRIVFWL
jgi:ABC-type polysaccharide/polyol phosphate export permease